MHQFIEVSMTVINQPGIDEGGGAGINFKAYESDWESWGTSSDEKCLRKFYFSNWCNFLLKLIRAIIFGLRFGYRDIQPVSDRELIFVTTTNCYKGLLHCVHASWNSLKNCVSLRKVFRLSSLNWGNHDRITFRRDFFHHRTRTHQANFCSFGKNICH